MRTQAFGAYPYLEMSGSPLRSRIDFRGTGQIPASPVTTDFLFRKVPSDVIARYLKMSRSGKLGQARLFAPSPEGREPLKRREGNWKLMAGDEKGPSSDSLTALLDRARQAGDRRSLRQWMDQILLLAQTVPLSENARDEIVRLLATRFLKEFIHTGLDLLHENFLSGVFGGELLFPKILSPLSRLIGDFRTSIQDVEFQSRSDLGDPSLKTRINFILEIPINADLTKWRQACEQWITIQLLEKLPEDDALDPLIGLAALVLGVFMGWMDGKVETVTKIFQEVVAFGEGQLSTAQNWEILAHLHFSLAQCLGVIAAKFKQPLFEEALKSLEKSCGIRERFSPQDPAPFKQIAYSHIVMGDFQGPAIARRQCQKVMRLFEKHGFTQEYRITKRHLQAKGRQNKKDRPLMAKLLVYESLEKILQLPELEMDAIFKELGFIALLLRMDGADLKTQIDRGQGSAVDIIKSLISTQKLEDLREKLFPNTSN